VSGYSAGVLLHILLCDNAATSVASDCNMRHEGSLQLTRGSTSGSVDFSAYVSDGTNTFCDLFNPCRLYVLENAKSLAVGAAYTLLTVSATCAGCAPTPDVSATPQTGVADDQQVAVSWRGFTVGASVTLLECSAAPSSVATGCDPATASLELPGTSPGAGTASFLFHTASETLFDCVDSACQVFVLESPSDLMNSAGSVPITASPVGVRGRPFPTTGRTLQRYTAANMTWGPMSETQAVAIAQANDVISAQPGMFRPYVAAMKAANPNLVLLVYINGAFSLNGQGGSAYPESWSLRDAAGNQVTSVGYGNYAMDPTNPGWVQDRITTCQAALAKSGYDGCYVDVLGPGPVQPGYLSGIALNPHTGQPWTTADWMTATSALQTAIATAQSPVPVVVNGLGSGAAFAAAPGSTSVLLASGAGALAESWMRPAGQDPGAYPGEAEWLQDVNLLTAASAAGAHAFVMVKVWSGATQQQVDAWHEFSLATFLMGADGSQYYQFTAANSFAGILSDSAWDHAPVGNPLGAYTVSNHLYERAFSTGQVLVNLAGSAATVRLHGSYRDLNGNPVTSVTVAPDGAAVLTAG
jgi:hypothetical protein